MITIVKGVREWPKKHSAEIRIDGPVNFSCFQQMRYGGVKCFQKPITQTKEALVVIPLPLQLLRSQLLEGFGNPSCPQLFDPFLELLQSECGRRIAQKRSPAFIKPFFLGRGHF
jgi:hypothetical protein